MNNEERTLDEALDLIDTWSEQMFANWKGYRPNSGWSTSKEREPNWKKPWAGRSTCRCGVSRPRKRSHDQVAGSEVLRRPGVPARRRVNQGSWILRWHGTPGLRSTSDPATQRWARPLYGVVHRSHEDNLWAAREVRRSGRSTTATRNRAHATSTNMDKGEKKWVRVKTKNGTAPIGSRGDAMTKIEKLIAARQWRAGSALIQDELLSNPTDHWLWTTLGLTYYEAREYAKAQLQQKSCRIGAELPLGLMGLCRLFIYEQPGALSVCNLDSSLEHGSGGVAYGEDGEGMDWAMQLLNDVHYRIGKYYVREGNNQQAIESFTKYLQNRSHGVGSIYDKAEVEFRLAKLQRPAPVREGSAQAKERSHEGVRISWPGPVCPRGDV